MDIIDCERCGVRCRIDPSRNSKAKMLRHSNKGLCVNCAVHDWLRNTYPVNIQLAQYGHKGLKHPQIQQLFTEIMQSNLADATPDEINWDLIVENWDLPFKNKVKATAMNPASQDVLDMQPEMEAREESFFREEMIAKEEGFGSLFEKQRAKLDKIVKEEFLPLLRKTRDEA